MKKIDTVLREYAKKLSDDTLYHLISRLSQNLCGDLAEVANVLAQDKAIDYLLSTANSSDEWFNLVDMINDAIKKEATKRGVAEKG